MKAFGGFTSKNSPYLLALRETDLWLFVAFYLLGLNVTDQN